jgi:hypothetical protein
VTAHPNRDQRLAALLIFISTSATATPISRAVAVPLYFLMVTYTTVQLSLYITKQFFGTMSLVSSLLLFNCGQAGLLGFDNCLPYRQQVPPELFQLTAGYTH